MCLNEDGDAKSRVSFFLAKNETRVGGVPMALVALLAPLERGDIVTICLLTTKPRNNGCTPM